MKPKQISELEQKVMNIIWELNNCSVKDVLIQIQNEKKIAYTTVATILQRLSEKGMVNRKEGKSGFVYSPKVSKENYSKNIARSFLKKFISSFGDAAIASFAESIDDLPQNKRKYLLELLEKYDKNS